MDFGGLSKSCNLPLSNSISILNPIIMLVMPSQVRRWYVLLAAAAFFSFVSFSIVLLPLRATSYDLLWNSLVSATPYIDSPVVPCLRASYINTTTQCGIICQNPSRTGSSCINGVCECCPHSYMCSETWVPSGPVGICVHPTASCALGSCNAMLSLFDHTRELAAQDIKFRDLLFEPTFGTPLYLMSVVMYFTAAVACACAATASFAPSIWRSMFKLVAFLSCRVCSTLCACCDRSDRYVPLDLASPAPVAVNAAGPSSSTYTSLSSIVVNRHASINQESQSSSVELQPAGMQFEAAESAEVPAMDQSEPAVDAAPPQAAPPQRPRGANIDSDEDSSDSDAENAIAPESAAPRSSCRGLRRCCCPRSAWTSSVRSASFCDLCLATRDERRLLMLWATAAFAGMFGTFVFVQYEQNTFTIYSMLIQAHCLNDVGSHYLNNRLSDVRMLHVFLVIFTISSWFTMMFAVRGHDVLDSGSECWNSLIRNELSCFVSTFNACVARVRHWFGLPEPRNNFQNDADVNNE